MLCIKPGRAPFKILYLNEQPGGFTLRVVKVLGYRTLKLREPLRIVDRIKSNGYERY